MLCTKDLSSLVLSTLATVMLCGCSSKLTRHQASEQITAALHPPQAKGLFVPRAVPGYELPFTDTDMSRIFHQEAHKGYGDAVAISGHPRSPDSEDYLVDALGELGYASVQHEGAVTEHGVIGSLRYPQSRTVQLTPKVGSVTRTGYSEEFSTGFSCYPQPAFTQCETPRLFEMTDQFQITGITQDEVHAKVNILVPWKLTSFGGQLQPYATRVAESEKKYGDDSSYDRYPDLYSWEHFLVFHSTQGSEPAVVLFQKFDDGWRIVDENGKSKQDKK